MQMNPMSYDNHPHHSASYEAEASAGMSAVLTILFTAAIAVLLLALVFAWSPWNSSGGTPNTQPTQQETAPDRDGPSIQEPPPIAPAQ